MSFQNCKIAGVGVDSAEYHAGKEKHPRGSREFVMSPSALKAFARLPSRWKRGWNPPDTKSKQWGNLVDCRTITPELFEARYAIQPTHYTVKVLECPECGSVSDAKKCRKCDEERIEAMQEKAWTYQADFCREWREAQQKAGKAVVDPHTLADCDAAVKRLFEVVDGDDTMRRWFDACDRQVLVTGEWHDEDTGLIVPVSALLDFVPRPESEFPGYLGDFKSAVSAHPMVFQRQAFKYGYHIQAAFDLDIYNAAVPDERPRDTWCFIIQENFAPWEPNRAIYGQEQGMGQPGFVEIGREASMGGYKGLMAQYCQCLKRGQWPTYNQNDETVDGFCVLTPEPFMAERATFSTRFAFTDAEEDSAPGVEVATDDIGN